MSTHADSAERARAGPRRVYVGGAPGCGKTSLLEQLIPLFIARGMNIAVISRGDAEGDEAQRLRYSGLIAPERVTARQNGVQRRDRVSFDDAAVRALARQFAGLDLVLLECATNDLLRAAAAATRNFSVLVSDVAGAAELCLAPVSAVAIGCDVLVINRADPELRQPIELHRVAEQLTALRGGRAPLLANCLSGEGIDAVRAQIVLALDPFGAFGGP